LPGGSVLMGGDYSPSAVLEAPAHAGAEYALDTAANSTAFLSTMRSWLGIPMTQTATWLTRGSYMLWAVQGYRALTASQKEYAACMSN
jgi:hypothetical protein